MGMYPEHLQEMINEDVQEFNFYDRSLENIKEEDFEKNLCISCSYSEDCTDDEKEICASHDYEYYDEECDYEN
ncbi:MAG: hypothetical protein K0S76_1883 [Herbinix sp.]|jgi:hypothetical protein|nr:hypothetical protein [Herbinix sp.]